MNTIEFKGKCVQVHKSLGYFGVQLPEEHLEELLKKENKRLLASIEGLPSKHCALLSTQSGAYFILVTKQELKKIQVERGADIRVTLERDTSKYGMYLPEEMEAVLQLDPEGEKCFEALTDGKKRSILHIIGKAKKSETRLKKAMVTIEYLKSVNGKFNFKELNEAFKYRNDMF